MQLKQFFSLHKDKVKIYRKALILSGLVSGFFAFSVIPSLSSYSKELNSSSLILNKSEIPAGMQFGMVPPPAKNLIKGNPWVLDKKSIHKFSRAIYGHANYMAIKKMVMVILAPKNSPYRDDIVYYGFEFKSAKSARIEAQKLSEVTKLNKSRSILLQGGNKAILLFSDSEYLLPTMQRLSKVLQNKLNK